MNKNIPLIVVLLLVLVGGIVYVASNSAPKYEPVPGSNPPSSSKAGLPVVQVDTSATTTNSTAIVNGTVNPNGANTEFWYEYSESMDFGSRTASYSIGSGFSPIRAPAYIEGLKATTNYNYRLTAKNSYGTTHSSVYNFRTTNESPKPAGKAPTSITENATDIARTSAKLNGQVNANGWAATYWFEYGTTMDLGSVTQFVSAGEEVGSKPAGGTLFGLSPLTKYYFRLNVQNQFGTVNGEILSFTTTGPLNPSKPTVSTDNATGVATTFATLKGRVNPNAADTVYWFEYGTDTSLANIVAYFTPEQKLDDGATAVTVTAKVTNLRSGTNYFYRLAARNQFGVTRGDVESFTTK